MFFNYLQKNVNTQKGIIPSCTKSFFTKGLLGGDIFLILLFSFDLTFFKFKMMQEGTTLRQFRLFSWIYDLWKNFPTGVCG